MIIVNFTGGLGNQMYQYAFYKSLKMQYPDTVIKMLDSCFGHNGFELDSVFGIEKDTCTSFEAIRYGEYVPSEIKYSKLLNRLNILRRKMIGFKKSYVMQENPSLYDNMFYNLDLSKSYVIDGYWQNTEYFNNIKPQLISEFDFRRKESNAAEIENKIESTNSVSIHVRRGDYIKVGFPVLSMEYYLKAISIIEDKVENPEYFVFSDDPGYVKKKFANIYNCNIVETNIAESSYIDMYLMSKCKHNIVANSTFSFWGAYLNCNESKVVVSPDKIREGHAESFACSDWSKINIFDNSIYIE